ncbi:hypothetical protein JOF29_005720 [Kribbella aluminosa]|uniref:Bifunctional DNA primase/polymerase-like protein n=1 Tax=Kribbella aluminosa TaxID=416017 RepID=A0ABS4USI9_9ACTN|nr:hypothetical protein [Kribbella aluminosa]
MVRRTNGLLMAARAFVERGIAIMPASPVVPDPAGTSWRTTWMCSCGDRYCETPGAHRLTTEPLTQLSQVSAAYDVASPPNLLIASGPQVAIWRVPLAAGSYAMRRLEQQRLTIWPPVMRLPDHGWIFCTAPTKRPTGLADAELVREDASVLAPPSRGPNGGRLRWLWSPRFPAVPLPEAEPVLAALAVGSMDVLRVAGAPDEPADAPSRTTDPAHTSR